MTPALPRLRKHGRLWMCTGRPRRQALVVGWTDYQHRYPLRRDAAARIPNLDAGDEGIGMTPTQRAAAKRLAATPEKCGGIAEYFRDKAHAERRAELDGTTLPTSDERIAFERWASAAGFNTHRDDTDKYRDYHKTTTRWAWLAWKARAARDAAEMAEPVRVKVR